ncbi:PIN domain-containing protein [Desulfofundulus sp. TPOSR]|uniref:type II toxin-antitoxin system VapC family toxin n=1 Tax=Desulfofundulus sp. TPOSR TaxID=2714340 RepID=UPI00140E87FB|nr:PIN domain-containing protein [Desulfofundulus sp. TPOSR]NHM26927.1 PIN domain-containing protein [Desulfofundulus sp. TPOSR]
MERIMVDTSAIYALLDRSDNMHQQAVSILKELSTKGVAVVITNFIVAECHALLVSRLSPEIARAWLKGLCWPVERVNEEDENRAREIIFTYSDKSFSFTDATTFAVMERLGISSAFAFDRHFIQFGFNLYGVES